MTRRTFTMALLLSLFLFAPSLISAQDVSVAAPNRDRLTQASVIRVVDGDTIHVLLDDTDDTIRLIGVDTPETVDPRKPVACFGQEASAFTKLLLAPSTEVWLEKDVSETDRYQRLLRYIWITYDPSDARFAGLIGVDSVKAGQLILFNQLLVSQGYAASSAYPPDVKYQSTFIEDQTSAREGGRGLWGACSAFGIPAGNEPGSVDPASTQVSTIPAREAEGGGQCDPSYPGVCIPPVSQVGDLNCGDVPSRRFEVVPPDPHGFDRDGDGVGCES